VGPFPVSTTGAGIIDEERTSGFAFTAAPRTGVPGSIGFGLAPVGLVTGSSYFMDDFQVNFLLRATQANTQSTSVTAPRLTLFNGQRAYVSIGTDTSYVSDLEPQVGQGAVAFDVTVDTIQSGVLLDVQATVSADRKYVTLTLYPELTNLLDLSTFSFQTAADGGGGGGAPGDDDDDDDDDDTPAALTTFIQLPEYQQTLIRTTVSVPDGGTLLLGGQTLAGEVELEVGVPILSKIPFLKRLFTNRSTAKDEQVLLILVKPTIIIQREQEQRQFPLLGRQAGS
jgi:type II secretory pathway component GspD/PulD (secretin)